MPTDTVENDLRKLIRRAIDNRKWLFCQYQSLWLSPDELAEANARGRFLWGVVNWKLRDPQEHVDEINAQIAGLERQRQSVLDRINQR